MIRRLWVRFNASGSSEDVTRSGRHRVTAVRQDQQIYYRHLRHPPLVTNYWTFFCKKFQESAMSYDVLLSRRIL